MNWDMVKLGNVCEVNPSTKGKVVSLNSEMPVSFLPMEAMEAGTGIMNPIDKELAKVKKGYTYFENGDVLFAKITPCMQNGKHAIAQNLTNGIGFGSTEFHVLRPKTDIIAEWIYYFVNQRGFLFNAVNFFQGAVGQQRLPDIFLKEAEIPLPPLDEQRRIAAEIERQLAIVEKAKQAATEQLAAARALNAAYLREAFEKNDYEQVSLDTISENLDSRRIPIKQSERKKGEYPYYGATGIVDYVDSYIYDEPILLISEDGANLIARTYPIAFSVNEKCWVNNHAHVLRFSNQYTQKYVEIYLNSTDLAKFISGSAQPKLNQEKLYEITIPLPPYDEQRSIIDLLETHTVKVNKMFTAIQSQLDAINAMPAAILRQAFSGQV